MFGDVSHRAYAGQQHFIVDQEGTAIVVTVPICDCEKIMSRERSEEIETDEADKSTASAQELAQNRLITFLDVMHEKMPDLPEEDVQKDIEEAIAAIRHRHED